MTLLDAMEKFKTTVIDHGTSDGQNYASQCVVLCEAFGAHTLLDNITTTMMVEWRDRMRSMGRRQKNGRRVKFKASTVNQYLKVLRMVLRKAHTDWATLAKLPVFKMAPNKDATTKGARTGKSPRFLSEDEERQLIIASPIHLRHFLTFLLFTGARKTEAVTLTWDQFDNLDLDPNPPAVPPFGPPIDENGVPYARVRFEHVPEDGRKTKRGVWRAVPLPDHVRLMLLRIRASHEANGWKGKKGRVFVGRKQGGKAWREVDNFDGVFRQARKQAGLDKRVAGETISLHSMRHTYASRLVMNRVPLIEVRDLLGHADIGTTQIYAKLAPTTLTKAVAVLQRYAPKGRAPMPPTPKGAHLTVVKAAA